MINSAESWTIKQYEYIIKNLTHIRIDLGISMTRLSSEAGVHINSMCKWEHGDSVPNVESLKKIGSALRINGYNPPDLGYSYTIDEAIEALHSMRKDVASVRKAGIKYGAVRHWAYMEKKPTPTFKMLVTIDGKI
jgi:transcriptional regulator with XRE-family HTH domain